MLATAVIRRVALQAVALRQCARVAPIAFRALSRSSSSDTPRSAAFDMDDFSNMKKPSSLLRRDGPAPALSQFERLGLHDELLKALSSFGFHTPTEVQSLGIPQIFKQQHVMLAAETGSGKTLAYLLPIIAKLRAEEAAGLTREPGKPRAIVLVPSRELVNQVAHMAKEVGHHAPLRIVPLVGHRENVYAEQLEQPVDMIISTPSKVIEYRKRGLLSFAQVRYVVLDEADSLFAQGFGDELKQIILPIKNRYGPPVPYQFVTVSATLPRSVEGLITENLGDVRKVITHSLHRPIPALRQRFVAISGHGGSKHNQLLNVLRDANEDRVMVFCNTLKSCSALATFLEQKRVPSLALHGDVDFKERLDRYERFVKGEVNILVCTDIASRGLDTTMVNHVILYDFPRNGIDYLHRVGRTARAQGKGRVTALVGRKDRDTAEAIHEAIKQGQSIGWTPLETKGRRAAVHALRSKHSIRKRRIMSVKSTRAKAPGQVTDMRPPKPRGLQATIAEVARQPRRRDGRGGAEEGRTMFKPRKSGGKEGGRGGRGGGREGGRGDGGYRGDRRGGRGREEFSDRRGGRGERSGKQDRGRPYRRSLEDNDE